MVFGGNYVINLRMTSHGFEERVDHIIRNIVALSKEIDLYMEVDDVTELLESHAEELSARDLIQLEKQVIEEEEETPTPEPKASTRQGLSKGFAEIKHALATFEAQDPNMERFTRVSRGIIDLLQCYKETLDEKRIPSVQSNQNQYFKKAETCTLYISCLYCSSFSTILLIFTLIHVVWNCFLFF